MRNDLKEVLIIALMAIGLVGTAAGLFAGIQFLQARLPQPTAPAQAVPPPPAVRLLPGETLLGRHEDGRLMARACTDTGRCYAWGPLVATNIERIHPNSGTLYRTEEGVFLERHRTGVINEKRSSAALCRLRRVPETQ